VVTAPHTGNNNPLIDLFVKHCEDPPHQCVYAILFQILRNPCSTLRQTGFIIPVMLNCTNILFLICLLTISGEDAIETDSLTYEAGLLTTQHDFQSSKWSNNENSATLL